MSNRTRTAGFTLVELLIVVIIGGLTMAAIYQTLITQDRSYRHQTAAISTQGTTRTALQLIASELREISASAGDAPIATGGSDLLMASPDSIRFRAFRKAGIICAVDPGSPPGYLDVWVPGEQFAQGDSIFIFIEDDPDTDDDDRWAKTSLQQIQSEASNPVCETQWSYDTQSLRSLPSTSVEDAEKGGLVRSYETVTYKSWQYDGEWVLARRSASGTVPLVGPILPPTDGGLRFRYFDASGNELTNPSTEAARAQVARVAVQVRAAPPPSAGPDQSVIDSLSTNVYLRGN